MDVDRTSPSSGQPLRQSLPTLWKGEVRMNPFEALVHCVRNSFNFSGRASRSEYWWFVFLVFLFPWILCAFPAPFLTDEKYESILVGVLSVPMLLIPLGLLPWLAVSARRLHDVGNSAASVFIWGGALLLAIAFAILLVMFHTNTLGLGTLDRMTVDPSATGFFANDGMLTVMSLFVVVVATGTVLIVGIVLLAQCAAQGTEEANRYGPPPTRRSDY